jgi:hypothetical protein
MTAPSLREAAQMALDALDRASATLGRYDIPGTQNWIVGAMQPALESLRAALALPDAEPVESWHEKADRLKKCVDYAASGQDLMVFRLRLTAHLNTVPATVERKPLTDEQKEVIWDKAAQLRMYAKQIFMDGMNAAEAAHGIQGAA